MYSRSLDYGLNPYQGIGYGSPAYNSDPVSFPTLSPYSFSNQQASPYSFHKQPQQVQNYYPPAREPHRGDAHSKTLQNKSFIDGFDNNNSALLNQQKSHARNLKRLFGNEDPSTEMVKHQQQLSYKEELQRQIEETRKRKQAEKQKIQKEEQERERKFYEGFKIQAQTKQSKAEKKDENGYFMMRTLHKFKKGKNETANKDNKQDIPDATVNRFPQPAIKGRGKTYQNKSSLDNWGDSQNAVVNPYAKSDSQGQPSPKIRSDKADRTDQRLTRMEEQIIKQRVNEQERLSKLLLFQQRVLQKINDIKSEIRNTALDIDSDKELQRVRNNLKAKPIPFDQDFFKSDVRKNVDTNHYYSLPKRQPRLPVTRYSVKLKDSRKNELGKSIKSQVTQFINDKNINSKGQQNQQAIQ